MKTKKISAGFLATLFYIGAILSLPSCARRETRMEAQSGMWKVTVVSVKQLAKQPAADPGNYPSARSQYDLVEVAFTAELLGPGGKIAVPKAVLIDAKGQKHESVEASRELPENVSKMPEGTAKEDAISRFMVCTSPELEGKEPCPVATGEKLSLTSSFVDPKDYANLKFSFGDVPAMLLRIPYEQLGAK